MSAIFHTTTQSLLGDWKSCVQISYQLRHYVYYCHLQISSHKNFANLAKNADNAIPVMQILKFWGV